MADPLSIISSVVGLATFSYDLLARLKKFYDDTCVVDETLSGLLTDVDNLHQVLGSMKETLGQDDMKSSLRAPGHGNHWENLSLSLLNGKQMLQTLYELLGDLNKDRSFMNKPMKQLGFQNAMDQIALYRERIQSYCTALQLSLQTVVM